MNTKNINLPEVIFENGRLIGKKVINSCRVLSDLEGIFKDNEAFNKMDKSTVIYEVISYYPVEENTKGGLFIGSTTIFPGQVGNEYFMTKGHFHLKRDRAEFYMGVEGEGMLILMDENRNTRAEQMFPGSLHYIPGGVAHRVANTGNEKLVFTACWPSDAGHNYETIASEGFARRLLNINGVPTLK